MSRRVHTIQYQATGTEQLDTYFDKVVKYIPADIVGAWVAVTGMVKDASDVPKGPVLWVCFAVGLVLAYAWTLRQTRESGKPPAHTQAMISTGSFFVWSCALVGGPFEYLSFYRHLYGSLLLVGYTLLVPLINPKE
jgi:hypothetical protein